MTFFFFNDTATTEIYTLSLHDALPISAGDGPRVRRDRDRGRRGRGPGPRRPRGGGEPALLGRDVPALSRRIDRKSTRLNSSHANISYAVFCLKKKNNKPNRITDRVHPI